MQPIATGAALTAYHNRLKSSHDFKVHIDILTLDETMSGTARFLDGQVNFVAGETVRRTANLTLSDPDGALDFTDASAWSGTSLWVDRLVRVRHVITVPNRGEFTAIPFIGPPVRLSRQGAEVQVECQDKSALAIRGARPYTAPKGALATSAIRALMSYCTGEFRFRIASHTRRLSKAYSVGLSNDAAPFLVAQRIARAELGMQLIYSCDGYLTLRPLPTQPVVDIGWVTEQASASADFSTISNYVRVTGGTTSKKTGTRTVTSQPISVVAAISPNSVAPARLQRQGVSRLLPLLIEETGYTKTSQTAARAVAELKKSAGVTADISASVVPMFHLDVDDLVTVHTSDTTTKVMRLSDSSIPLGVGGDMSIGFRRWVSKKAFGKPRSRYLRTTKITKTKRHPTRKKRHHK